MKMATQILGSSSTSVKATWINITKENGLAVQAMVGDKAIDVCEGNSVEKLVTFLEEHMETAKT
jgi:hypothetical protein